MSKTRILLTLLAWPLGLAVAVAQPVITTQPLPQTKFAGESALLSVEAAGTPPLSFQWLKVSALLSGQTNATLLLTNLQAADRGIYSVTVSNAGGPTTSDGAELTVVTPPTVTPANPTASLFADLKLTAKATPAGPVTYQWRFKGEPIAGEQAVTLTLTNIQKTHAGDYSVVASYSFGSITSAVATLKITSFNSMYCFGDSWTDTGGNGCTWPSPDYYKNRACNGPMWPEFLSTNLGIAYGNTRNYAVCGSTSADIYNQVASRPFAPAKPELYLYALGNPGADFLRFYPPTGLNGVYVNLTNKAASTRLIETAVLNFSNAVQRLYQKGARSITYWHQTGTNGSDIIALGTAQAELLDAYTRSYNSRVNAAMELFSRSRPDVRLYPINLYSPWNEISTNPTAFGFTETTANALGDPRLRDKSFSGPGADYLWWDRSHATSKFHVLLATWMFEELTNSVLEQLEVTPASNSRQIQMNHLLIGRDYTFQGSPDLNHWQDLQTFTAAAGTNQWTGTADNPATAFYRLKW